MRNLLLCDFDGHKTMIKKHHNLDVSLPVGGSCMCMFILPVSMSSDLLNLGLLCICLEP
jgi:hypothetical protein